MSSQYVIQVRFAALRHGSIIQANEHFVLVFADHHMHQIGLHNGRMVSEFQQDIRHHVRHPTLPLIFEYPISSIVENRPKWGIFYVTRDATRKEQLQLGLKYGRVTDSSTYGKSVLATTHSSRPKRLSCFEDSDSDEEGNFLW